MRTSSSAGFDFWEAIDGFREAFAPRPGGRPWQGPAGRDVRAAILSALTSGPKNGRQVMETIGGRSGGAWMPSASQVYPTLQQLSDEGLVSTANDGERTVYQLTETGRIAAAEAAAASAHDSHPRSRESSAAVPKAGAKLAQAAAQVVQSGTREQQERAAAILDETRRKLYAILAED